jgi:transketolase
MGGITNGINYDGLFRCSCATFLVFTDYLRGSMRVAALSHVPSVCMPIFASAAFAHSIV